MYHLIKHLFFLIVLGASLTACYRMPDEDCMSTIPMTNNPQVVPQRGPASWMPGATY